MNFHGVRVSNDATSGVSEPGFGGLSSFREEVYSVVRLIPHGKVLGYGHVAALVGRPGCARAVGTALWAIPAEMSYTDKVDKAVMNGSDGANLPVGVNGTVPCHRVVNSAGRCVPNWPAQRTLLENEGVTFRPNGHVDMTKHLWRPEELG